MKQDNQQFINDVNSVGKQGGIFIGGSVIELFLRYLYSVILARMLGAASLGIYFLGFTIMNFIFLIAKLEVQEGVLKLAASFKGIGDKGRAKGVMYSAVIITLLSSILVGIIMFMLAYPIANKVFKEPLLAKVIIGFLVSMPFMSIVTIFASYFQANLKMKYCILSKGIIQPLANILIFFLVYSFGARLFGAIFSYVISVIIALFFTFYFLNKKFNLFDKNVKPIFQTKEILDFSLPLVIVSLLHFSIQWVDTLILGYFRDAAEVGIYSIAIRIASLCAIFFVGFAASFAPMISDFYNRKMKTSLEAMFKISSKWIIMLTLPFLLLVILFPESILNIFGEDFIIGRNALIVLCMGQIFSTGVGVVYYMILMSGRSKLVFLNVAVICILNFILDLVLIPRYGFLGAAIAHSASLIAFNITMLFEAYYILKMHPYDLKVLKPLIASCCAGLILYVIKTFVRFLGSELILASIFFVSYWVVLYCLKFDREDKAIIGLLKSKFSAA